MGSRGLLHAHVHGETAFDGIEIAGNVTEVSTATKRLLSVHSHGSSVAKMRVQYLAAGVILLLAAVTACYPSSKRPDANGRRTDLRSKPDSHSCSVASNNQRRQQVLREYHVLLRVGQAPASAFPTFPPERRPSRPERPPPAPSA
jgi:hypothetical protein